MKITQHTTAEGDRVFEFDGAQLAIEDDGVLVFLNGRQVIDFYPNDPPAARAETWARARLLSDFMSAPAVRHAIGFTPFHDLMTPETRERLYREMVSAIVHAVPGVANARVVELVAEFETFAQRIGISEPDDE